MVALCQSNLGTVFYCEWNGSFTEFGVVLNKYFLSFGPTIQGFSYSRSLVSIDATPFYGKYTSKLLIIVAFDANNQIFSLCYGFTDSES